MGRVIITRQVRAPIESVFDAIAHIENLQQAVPEIIEAARMMGPPDYLLRVVTADAEAFEALYMDRLASLPHVHTLTSQLAMKVVKRTSELPIGH